MRRPYTVLFYTLLAALGLLPLFRALSLPEWPIDIVLALSLLEASSAAMHSRHRLLIGLLATVIVVGLGGRLLGLGVIFGEASSVGWVIVAVFASAGALRFMFNPGATWSEQLYAALSAYLLVGLFMGVLFTAIAARSPGAFLVLGTAPSPGTFDLGTGVYFSFVTLTTLGYGDIVPANELSRGLAIFEAVSGQLYLAVLVAALVNRRAPVQA
jgi:voltage-gated potassium channel Kch